jgi:hypothetical protein
VEWKWDVPLPVTASGVFEAPGSRLSQMRGLPGLIRLDNRNETQQLQE